MAASSTNTITLQPDLLAAVNGYSEEAHKPVETVIEEALRFYIALDSKTNDMRRLHKERAAALGLEIEDYIARMMKEWRREDREAEERNAAHRP